MLPNQRNSGTSSRSRSNYSIPTDEELVKEYIPHFYKVFKKRTGKRTNKQQEQTEQDEGESLDQLLDADGNITLNTINQIDNSVKEKAYQDIQDSRSYSSTIAYGYKQLEFLRFCAVKNRYQPALKRYLANESNLLNFLYFMVRIKLQIKRS